MKILIFKTDIESEPGVDRVSSLLNEHPIITRWSIDTDDVDNVLRIEAMRSLQEREVIELVAEHGFTCEELPD
ncbi:hypothetical protein KFE98_01065 [bacterium SCSIO 12741]|nr:hypothetical protein KFE98_01065 [bacterium SCSIO 12741]